MKKLTKKFRLSTLAILTTLLSLQGVLFARASDMPSAFDCERARKSVLQDLQNLNEQNKDVEKVCEANSKSKLNNTVTDEHIEGKGACQLNYYSIRQTTQKVDAQLKLACGAVNEARQAAGLCQAQRACLAATNKYKQAKAHFDKALKYLDQGEKELKERQEANRALAEQYHNRMKKMADDMNGALPPQEAISKVTENHYGDFGYGSAEEFFKTYNWPTQTSSGPLDTLREYTSSFSAKNDKLGPHLYELAKADETTQSAAKISADLKDRIGGVSKTLDQQMNILDTRQTNMGSVPLGSSGSPMLESTITGIRAMNSVETLNSISGASRAQGASVESSSQSNSLSKPESNTSSTTFDSNHPNGSLAKASFTSKEYRGNSGRMNGINQEQGPNASAPKGDIPENVAKADPLSFSAADNSPMGNNYDDFGRPLPKTKDSSRGPASTMGASSFSDSNKDPMSSNSAIVGGQIGASRTTKATDDKDTAIELYKSGKPLDTSLRERLRQHLAERRARGDDTDASDTVDELFQNLHEQEDSAENTQTSEHRRDQSGLLVRESEPLFYRVHQAHQRFLRRTPRPQVEI